MTAAATPDQSRPGYQTVLIVGGGSDLHVRLREKTPGLRTVVLARSSVVQWLHGLSDNEEVVLLNDAAEPARWLEAARYLNQGWHLTAVASFAEIDQDMAALVAADLGLECHAIDTVRAVHDKNAMRKRLTAAGVESLPYRQVRSAGELHAFFDEVGPPLILKPSEGRASVGVEVIEHRNDIDAAFSRTTTASAPRMVKSPALAERLVIGREFSVESVTHGGHHYVVAISEQTKKESTKVEIGHVMPASIRPDQVNQVVSHVRAALDALGVRSGITHTEVILGADGATIVETHLRLAGDEIPVLVEMTTGLNLGDLHVMQIAGVDLAALPELQSRRDAPHYRSGASIRYLAPDLDGQLVRIDGLDSARQTDGVIEVVQLKEDGADLVDVASSYDRLVSVRTADVEPETASAQAAAAVAALSVVVVAP